MAKQSLKDLLMAFTSEACEMTPTVRYKSRYLNAPDHNQESMSKQKVIKR